MAAVVLRLSSCWLVVLCLLLPFSAAAHPAENLRLQPGEHQVRLDGVDFWYVVEGRGPVLVIQAPGWGIGSSYLRHGLASLTKDFTLVFYDPRGSGKSSRPADGSRMATSDMVEDLERLRGYWNIQRLNLLGHSHGGEVASAYAARYPSRVRRLILVDSNISGYWDSVGIGKIIDKLSADVRFKEAVKEFKKQEAPQTDAEFSAKLRRMLPLYFYRPDAQRAFEQDMDTSLSAWTYQHFLEAERKRPLRDTLPQVGAPTLVVVGEADFLCTLKTAQKIHSEIKNSRLVVIRRCGHFPWIERPEVFFKSIGDFLSGQKR